MTKLRHRILKIDGDYYLCIQLTKKHNVWVKKHKDDKILIDYEFTIKLDKRKK